MVPIAVGAVAVGGLRRMRQALAAWGSAAP